VLSPLSTMPSPECGGIQSAVRSTMHDTWVLGARAVIRSRVNYPSRWRWCHAVEALQPLGSPRWGARGGPEHQPAGVSLESGESICYRRPMTARSLRQLPAAPNRCKSCSLPDSASWDGCVQPNAICQLISPLPIIAPPATMRRCVSTLAVGGRRTRRSVVAETSCFATVVFLKPTQLWYNTSRAIGVTSARRRRCGRSGCAASTPIASYTLIAPFSACCKPSARGHTFTRRACLQRPLRNFCKLFEAQP